PEWNVHAPSGTIRTLAECSPPQWNDPAPMWNEPTTRPPRVERSCATSFHTRHAAVPGTRASSVRPSSRREGIAEPGCTRPTGSASPRQANWPAASGQRPAASRTGQPVSRPTGQQPNSRAAPLASRSAEQAVPRDGRLAVRSHTDRRDAGARDRLEVLDVALRIDRQVLEAAHVGDVLPPAVELFVDRHRVVEVRLVD